VSVFVRYMYPICAEVDLEEGEVVRVVVDDESPSQAVEVVDDSLQPVSAELKDAAVQVAESTTWPSWDYGW
jgi:predicted DNA-binding antitoxin AbrB/MazE fold protein